jgi:hypothetical protein
LARRNIASGLLGLESGRHSRPLQPSINQDDGGSKRRRIDPPTVAASAASRPLPMFASRGRPAMMAPSGMAAAPHKNGASQHEDTTMCHNIRVDKQVKVAPQMTFTRSRGPPTAPRPIPAVNPIETAMDPSKRRPIRTNRGRPTLKQAPTTAAKHINEESAMQATADVTTRSKFVARNTYDLQRQGAAGLKTTGLDLPVPKDARSSKATRSTASDNAHASDAKTGADALALMAEVPAHVVVSMLGYPVLPKMKVKIIALGTDSEGSDDTAENTWLPRMRQLLIQLHGNDTLARFVHLQSMNNQQLIALARSSGVVVGLNEVTARGASGNKVLASIAQTAKTGTDRCVMIHKLLLMTPNKMNVGLAKTKVDASVSTLFDKGVHVVSVGSGERYNAGTGLQNLNMFLKQFDWERQTTVTSEKRPVLGLRGRPNMRQDPFRLHKVFTRQILVERVGPSRRGMQLFGKSFLHDTGIEGIRGLYLKPSNQKDMLIQSQLMGFRFGFAIFLSHMDDPKKRFSIIGSDGFDGIGTVVQRMIYAEQYTHFNGIDVTENSDAFLSIVSKMLVGGALQTPREKLFKAHERVFVPGNGSMPRSHWTHW